MTMQFSYCAVILLQSVFLPLLSLQFLTHFRNIMPKASFQIFTAQWTACLHERHPINQFTWRVTQIGLTLTGSCCL